MHIPTLLLWSLTVFCFSATVNAQKNKQTSEIDLDFTFKKIEIEAGTNKFDWDVYMKKSTVLPASVAKSIPAGIYKVLVSFIINIDGKVSEVKADSDPGYGLASRAVDIFKGYKGKWQPANQCGRLVKSYKKLPVVFTIPGE
jgi:protein TonB